MLDSPRLKLITLSGFSAVLLAGFAFWLSSRQTQSSSSAQPIPQGFESLPTTASLPSRSSKQVRNSLEEKGIGLTAQDWLKSIQGTQGVERDELLREIIDACYRSRNEFAPIACELAELWAESEPGPALRFLSNIHGLPGVIPVERRLTGEWVTRDLDGAFDYLGTISKADSMVPVGQLAMISSLGQNEKPEVLGSYINWIQSLDPAESADLRKSAMLALVETSEPTCFQQIGKLLETSIDSPYTMALAATLVTRQASKNPAEALEWTKRLKAPAARELVVEQYFHELTDHHPDQAATLIQGTNLSEFSSITTGTDESKHDQVLAKILEGLVGTSPDHALQYLAYLHDPKLQDTYRNLAQQTINESAQQELDLIENSEKSIR